MTRKQDLWQSNHNLPKTLSWHWPFSRRNTGRFPNGTVAFFTSVRLAFFTGIRTEHRKFVIETIKQIFENPLPSKEEASKKVGADSNVLKDLLDRVIKIIEKGK